MNKDKNNKSTRIVAPLILAEREEPDDLYLEMKEINDNQSLIGLSKEQVVTLLGQPKYELNDKYLNVYEYRAGTVMNRFIFF